MYSVAGKLGGNYDCLADLIKFCGMHVHVCVETNNLAKEPTNYPPNNLGISVLTNFIFQVLSQPLVFISTKVAFWYNSCIDTFEKL